MSPCNEPQEPLSERATYWAIGAALGVFILVTGVTFVALGSN